MNATEPRCKSCSVPLDTDEHMYCSDCIDHVRDFYDEHENTQRDAAEEDQQQTDWYYSQ